MARALPDSRHREAIVQKFESPTFGPMILRKEVLDLRCCLRLVLEATSYARRGQRMKYMSLDVLRGLEYKPTLALVGIPVRHGAAVPGACARC